MMQGRIHFLAIIALILILSSCGLPSSSSEPAPTMINLPASSTPAPTDTSMVLQSSATPISLAIKASDPDSVAFDFVELVCSAEWSNNAYYLPCPGHLEDITNGYIESTDHTVLEGMISAEGPMLIGLPGQGGGSGVGVGLFGHYPPLLIYPGDTFRAVIACQGDAECNLDFSLEYFDAFGKYHDTEWSWLHQAGDGPREISADISSLAGQTVDLALVLRAKDEPAGQWAVWIQPQIIRDPNAQPPPTLENPPTTQPETDDETPGVISGMVAMESAPPYLNDPGTENSLPVAVVFFNLDDGTYWWIHTSLTGHPYYQMTVSPGIYQVVAYAKGVGGAAYVSAGYTGQNPSCGNNLKTVTVPPNGKAENIVIADWNWTCGGTAFRPDKPSGVPLP
jgi:hypothetical protein